MNSIPLIIPTSSTISPTITSYGYTGVINNATWGTNISQIPRETFLCTSILMALQSSTTVSIVTNAFSVHAWPSHETSSPRARKNTKDLVRIVFSRVVRSSEIQVEEHRFSLFCRTTLSHPSFRFL